MVEIFANLAAWDFQRSVETLLRGFNEAVTSLDRLADQRTTELLEYEVSLANGAEPIGQWDEDGLLLWEESHRLQTEIDELDGARMALRKAIAIQLYHLWERTTRRRTSSKQGDDHETMVGRLRSTQQPVHDRLKAVSLLVNTLKHGNPKKGVDLARAWPEVVGATIAFPDWYDRIVLTDKQIQEIADIVVSSGPQLRFKVGDWLEPKLSP